jgi:(1->4)-alpha-D-glucan 1-alpha-D-glucosylmutase
MADDASPRCYLPESWAGGGRMWGFAAHLYALRSQRNWGMGDFTDLHAFARLAKTLGADVVGINPLHALHWLDPDAASPYSPTSRRFLNPLYVDVEAVPEFAVDPAASGAMLESLAGDLRATRASARVEYALVGRCKRAALEALYVTFARGAGAARRREFEIFCAHAGPALERFARYEALNERYARDEGRTRGWMTWPESYRNPRGAAVTRFARRARERIDFYKYLQFVAHEQLAAVARDPRAAGLYLDLAVGVDANSADVWSARDDYLLDRTVGAPPDPLGPQGQNWGLAPFDPEKLADDGGRAFAALLHDAMRYATALRIDHVMSLLRLFHIPAGSAAAQGAYVAYPFDLLLELTADASNAARCVVVGEDLGTVPDGFRARMERAAILSYRLLLFERDGAGTFRPPEAYPELALATATTHDLPTLPGWVLGRDLDVRAVLGQLDGDALRAEHGVRRVDATRLLEALAAAGELDAGAVERLHRTIDAGETQPDAYAPLVAAAYRFLGASAARMVLVQLDDALGEIDQVNLPGTYGEYPNWRRKCSAGLEQIAGDERIARLAAEVGARVRGGRLA